MILPEFCIFRGELGDDAVRMSRERVSVLEVLIVTRGQPDQVNNAQVSVKGLSTRETGEHDSFEFVSN